MCGICGIVRLRPEAAPPDLEELRRTRDAMAVRGPDGSGEWRSEDGNVLLGHRRLAILDLSPAGAQPMASADGRYRIVYNGEIYNFRELREELEATGERFRSESDTEVILALWAREGPPGLARMRGMFALAIWDGFEGSLALARDPFGIKPLYYATEGGCLRFASQVKALEAGGALSREVDAGGLGGFLMWGSVPEPWTIRRAIRALPAGHVLRAENGRVGEPKPLPDPPGPPQADPAEALEDAVRAHLVSDVPVAVFLSSGMDSSVIAALAAKNLSEPLRTFTVTFEGWEGTARDEGPLARRVAEAIGAQHVERKLGRSEVAALWPETLAAMDQPSIDGFNTFVVARAAHEEGIKVALSGLGGDELLGSYPSFRDVPRWAARLRFLRRFPLARRAWPSIARRARPGQPKLAGALELGGSLPGAYFLRRGLFLPSELPGLLGVERAREVLKSLDPVAQAASIMDRADGDCSARASAGSQDARDSWRQVQSLETGIYLRNQLLRDSDWAAMASSLELRVPLVDGVLWRQLGWGRRKSNARVAPRRALKSDVLSAVARRRVPGLPDELWKRAKSGFGVPLVDWVFPREDGKGHAGGGASRRLARRLLERWGG